MEAWARKHTRFILDPVVSALARTGISPNALTFLGLLINVVAGILIGLGQVIWGGVVMTFIGMPFDAIDGALARATQKQSRFGAFFDSTLDRVAEAALLIGLAALFIQRADALSVLVAFAAMVGSFMVSYTRARAEGLDIECKVGLFSRLGRFLLLAVGLLLNQPVITVWLLAILSTTTAIQRVVHVYNQTRT
ncbi:MAG: CDP-alcohol phosphatidyltransferase family protein [Chloroflexi bacterium]|nr:CDP-alcohol phosphatidyltransferase family protein [Chloroflexota bacterium]MCL5275931.1 CDP-alcohol phosphatidyltransferase family protein [Chloroflexota bacterium]